jgi:hypothetical protein
MPNKDENVIINQTGSAREFSNHPYHTISWLALQRVTDVVYQEGSENYGPNNWRKGLPFSDTLNHLMNHLVRWELKQLGQLAQDDEDDLAKVMWGVMTLMECEITHPELNNLADMKTEGKRVRS